MHLEEEIVTNSLSVEQLQESIPEMSRLLAAIDRRRISVEYGWGCNFPTDKLWSPTQIEQSDLQEYIEESRKNGIVTLGSSDLIVRDLEGSMNFTICHESDLHFVTNDKRLLQQVATMWIRKGFTVYVSLHTTGGRSPLFNSSRLNDAKD
jgi:hypothetical protein